MISLKSSDSTTAAVVKEGDDLMCATRYAIMMLRYASTTRAYHNFRRKLVYSKGGWL
jgi:hypothetical protein